jgi:hypothetical protein
MLLVNSNTLTITCNNAWGQREKLGSVSPVPFLNNLYNQLNTSLSWALPPVTASNLDLLYVYRKWKVEFVYRFIVLLGVRLMNCMHTAVPKSM